MKLPSPTKIIIISSVLLLFGFSVFFAINRSGQKPPAGPDIITLPADGGTVTAKNFTKNPLEKVEENMLLADTADFSIAYFGQDKAFAITILSAPAITARLKAEAEFLKILGIKEADACRLNVSLSVPNQVDETLSGQDYGLSFCPQGREF